MPYVAVGNTQKLIWQPGDTAASSAVVTLTDPMGAPHVPTVSGSGMDGFTSSYLMNLAGRWLVSWLASPTGESSTDVLNVSPADPRFLIGIADARSALRTTAQQSAATDDEIRSMLAAVTVVLEDVCGPILSVSQSYTTDGGDRAALNLPQLPTVGVNAAVITSVTVDGVAWASPARYKFDAASGVLAASTGTFSGTVDVAYTAGGPVVPPNILEAAREQFRLLWQIGRQGARPTTQQAQIVYTPSGHVTTQRVMELCAGSARVGGFA